MIANFEKSILDNHIKKQLQWRNEVLKLPIACYKLLNSTDGLIGRITVKPDGYEGYIRNNGGILYFADVPPPHLDNIQFNLDLTLMRTMRGIDFPIIE
eukprot:Pgem_evm2s9439